MSADRTSAQTLLEAASELARVAGDVAMGHFRTGVRVETKGYTPSEQVIGEAFDNIFATAPGRIILATFASNPINRGASTVAPNIATTCCTPSAIVCGQASRSSGATTAASVCRQRGK